MPRMERGNRPPASTSASATMTARRRRQVAEDQPLFTPSAVTTFTGGEAELPHLGEPIMREGFITQTGVFTSGYGAAYKA